MQIEAGKFYRTRDGKKAFVAAVMLPNPLGKAATHPVRGHIGDYAHAWNTDGRYSLLGESRYDLVAPWVDPPTPLAALKDLVDAIYHQFRISKHPELIDSINNAEAAIAEAEKAAEHGAANHG